MSVSPQRTQYKPDGILGIQDIARVVLQTFESSFGGVRAHAGAAVRPWIGAADVVRIGADPLVAKHKRG